MSIRLHSLIRSLELIAPLSLAENWDNVGLLSGDSEMPVSNVMTCLTVSKETVEEAIEKQVDLIVTHHPIPFKPIQRFSTASNTGKWLWKLTSNRIAIYSPHTAWDNTIGGINDQLAAIIGLHSVQSIVPCDKQIIKKLATHSFPSPVTSHSTVESEQIAIDKLGAGRVGFVKGNDDPTVEINCMNLLERLREKLTDMIVGYNDSLDAPISRVAIVCGSGGSFIESARQANADLLLTGEATYHQMLDAQASGVKLLTIGHYASERFAMNKLATWMASLHPDCNVFASQKEKDAFGQV